MRLLLFTIVIFQNSYTVVISKLIWKNTLEVWKPKESKYRLVLWLA